MSERAYDIYGGLSLALAALLFGLTTGSMVLALPLALLALLPSVVKARGEPDSLGEVALAAITLGGGWSLAQIDPPYESAFRGWVMAFGHELCTALLVFAGGFGLVRAKRLGRRPRQIALPVLLTVLGAGQSGATYAMLALPSLLLFVMSLRPSQAERPSLLPKSGRERLMLAVSAGACLLIAVPLSASVPRLHAWTVQQVFARLRYRTGFNDGVMQLGALDSMLTSNAVVARVFELKGEKHLRGNVLRGYYMGRWRQENDGPELPSTADVGDPPEGAVRVELSGSVPRMFLPLHATDIWMKTGEITVDEVGSVGIPRTTHPERYWYTVGDRTKLPVAGPGSSDIYVPREIRGAMSVIAAQFTEGAETPAAKVQAIAAKLERDYRYSLSFERPDGQDPVLHFLMHNKQGHCEYFASALALLSRASGVPARVVTGFRVSEYSPVGKYHIVRERNAHAWAEVYVNKTWVTVDATPAASFEVAGPSRTGGIAAVWDGVKLGINMLWKLATRDARKTSLTLIPLVLVWWAVRALRARRAQRALLGVDDTEGPLPALSTLLDRLASAGLRREASETLEAFADRVEAEGRGEAALLRRYAAFRYGGEGDAGEIARALVGR